MADKNLRIKRLYTWPEDIQQTKHLFSSSSLQLQMIEYSRRWMLHTDEGSWIEISCFIKPEHFFFFAMALPAHSEPGPLIHLRNHFFSDSRTPWTSDQLVARPLPKHRTTQTQNKRRQTFMPWVGLEPTIPASEQAKTVHASDSAATVTGKVANKTVSKQIMKTWRGRQNSLTFFCQGRIHLKDYSSCLLSGDNKQCLMTTQSCLHSSEGWFL
jgi:hypothetical protein